MSAKVLVVGGCPAPYHRFETAAPPIRSALESLGLEVTTTGIYHPDGGDAFIGDYTALSDAGLQGFDALVLYTTGKERFGADVEAIVRYVEEGKALIGIHNATDSFTDHPSFIALIGGKFRTHPAQLDITTEIMDTVHPITNGLKPFTVHDELYLFTDYDPSRVHLLAQTRSVEDNGPVPIAWTREQGAGRVFYISLGHNPSTLADSRWQTFFKNGVEWALRRR
jgi:type 1 glutamine amidotransferase